MSDFAPWPRRATIHSQLADMPTCRYESRLADKRTCSPEDDRRKFTQTFVGFQVVCVKQVVPEVIGKSASLPLTAALARFVRVLLAVQCPLQTTPITQPRVRYIHTVVPHVFYKLHCAVRLSSPHQKKICLSLTGDINAQSFHWNNAKMKIAYNFAYVQIETFNFTFARQAFIM